MGKEAVVKAYDSQPDEKKIISLRHGEAKEILVGFTDFEIEDDADYEIAAEGLKEIKRIAKELEERRKKITQPINAALREFNSLFKPPQTMLSNAEGYFKRKLQDYSSAVEARSRVAMLAAAEASRAGDFDTAHEASKGIVERPVVQGITHTDYYDWEIVDVDQVPAEFLVTMVNAAAVEKHIKEAGKNEPPAVAGLLFVKKTRTRAGT